MSKVSSSVNEATSDLRSLTGTAKDITERAREVAATAADSTVSFAKKYPVHTALGALAVGGIVGFLARRPK